MISVLDPLCVLIISCLVHFTQLELPNEEKSLKFLLYFSKHISLNKDDWASQLHLKPNATKRVTPETKSLKWDCIHGTESCTPHSWCAAEMRYWIDEAVTQYEMLFSIRAQLKWRFDIPAAKHLCPTEASSQYRTEMSSAVCCGSYARSGRLVHITFCCFKDGIVEDIIKHNTSLSQLRHTGMKNLDS